MKRSAWLWLLLLPTFFPAAARSQPRVELPIREVELSDGTPRYAVPVTLGGTLIDAGLDSGSTGLRIMPGTVPDGPEGGRDVSYSYDSGTELRGRIASIAVALGGRALSGPVPVQLVQTVACTFAKPNCPARRIPQAQFGIQGDGLPGEGFKAILGINMARDDAPNPFVSLGVRRWIIELPLRHSRTPGRLILNPTDDEVQGYTILRIDPSFSDRKGGMHDAIRGCVTDKKTSRSYCGPLDLDTGAPGIRVISPGRETSWIDGDPAQITIFDGSKPVQGAAFVVGQRDQQSRVAMEQQPRVPAPRIQAGIMPYYAFDVLYDTKAESIGLKPR